MEEVREAWSTVVPLNSGFKYVPTPDTVLHLSSCCLEVDAKCSVVLSCSTEGVKNIKLAVATSDEPQCNLRAQVYEEAILTVTSTPKQKGHVLLSGLRVPCEEKFVSAAAPAAASAADAEAVKVGKDTNVGKEAKAETTKAATKPEAAKAAVPESAPTPSAASKRAAPEEAEHRPAKAAKTASPKQSAKAPPAPAAAAAPAAKAAATATTAASTAATKTNAAASTTAAATAAAAKPAAPAAAATKENATPKAAAAPANAAEMTKTAQKKAKKAQVARPISSGSLRGGVQYEVMKLGNGSQATLGKLLKVQYEAFFPDGKPFEQGSMEFRLGIGAVLRGLDIGVKGMIEGEKRRLMIPSRLAYGPKGHPPLVAPDTDLLFEVDLVQCK
mmetsp:Transcript_12891/g.28593  ORF Transcript_12891/g.28593 Transcript_12891/m.28593 type:complete len:387 (-) Transcript_12891:43-1203(-)